jgi:HEAT repeat protein
MKLRLEILAAMLSMSSVVHAQSAPSVPKEAKAIKEVNAIKEAKAIKVADREPTGDEELALAALEGLMAQPSERALPILKKVLAGTQSTLVKQRALFVLGQTNSPEARQILAQTARSTDVELRGEAIRSIGISGDKATLEALKAVYDSGTDDVKKEVLKAWHIAGQRELVFQVAMNAKSESEANEAIRMLGVMGATEELRKLADRPNAARGLIDAYAISGDLPSLRKIAEGNGSRELKIEAVRKMGIIQGNDSRTALRQIYSSAADAELKDAALHGLMISGDEQGLLELYRAAKNPEEKRRLLRVLSTMDGDAALQAIDQALESKK